MYSDKCHEITQVEFRTTDGKIIFKKQYAACNPVELVNYFRTFDTIRLPDIEGMQKVHSICLSIDKKDTIVVIIDHFTIC